MVAFVVSGCGHAAWTLTLHRLATDRVGTSCVVGVGGRQCAIVLMGGPSPIARPPPHEGAERAGSHRLAVPESVLPAARLVTDVLRWLHRYDEHWPDLADGVLVVASAAPRTSLWPTSRVEVCPNAISTSPAMRRRILGAG